MPSPQPPAGAVARLAPGRATTPTSGAGRAERYRARGPATGAQRPLTVARGQSQCRLDEPQAATTGFVPARAPEAEHPRRRQSGLLARPRGAGAPGRPEGDVLLRGAVASRGEAPEDAPARSCGPAHTDGTDDLPIIGAVVASPWRSAATMLLRWLARPVRCRGCWAPGHTGCGRTARSWCPG